MQELNYQEQLKQIEKYVYNEDNYKHKVFVVFVSPLTKKLEHREGSFTEYFEAAEFAQMMEDRYKNYNIEHTVYINGEVF